MIIAIICPKCGSQNCEISVQEVTEDKGCFYPAGTVVSLCYLCYGCGASHVAYR